jgi:DNA-binding Lrp family transcriptional regulator
MLTELEKKIIASLQEDMAVTERPYLNIAQDLEISVTELLANLKDLCDRGVIRRFGATLRHQRTGFTANAMVACRAENGIFPAGIPLLPAQPHRRLAV